MIRQRRAVGGLRWVLCGSLVLAAHAAVAWQLFRDTEIETDPMPAGAMVIELAPVAVAREPVPADVPPGPDQVQADAGPDASKAEDAPEKQPPQPEPSPEPVPELPKLADGEIQAPAREKVEVQEAPAAPPPSLAAAVTSATVVDSKVTAAVAAAPVQGTHGPETSVSVPRWTSRLLALLERNKRYPASAQRQREEGTATVAFVIDRQGRLVTAEIQKSSGSAALDEEAIALLKRASPLPPPPDGLGGAEVSLAVPVQFKLQR